MLPPDRRVSIVLLTHERPDELARTLTALAGLPEQPPLIVVDNASRPGSVGPLVARHPRAEWVRCARNLGAAGRNAGVSRVRTPYVAFCDDDTWWAPGALSEAVALLDAHPDVGVLSARVLVGPDRREDPTCTAMRSSPLAGAGLPGPQLIGFMAGACVMRTEAFRAAGGYEPRFFLGAEEWLLSLDLMARGWAIVYADALVVHHHPATRGRDPRGRRIAVARNRLWTAWLRLPARAALACSLSILREARQQRVLAPVLRQCLPGLPWVLRRRATVPPSVTRLWQTVARGLPVSRPPPPHATPAAMPQPHATSFGVYKPVGHVVISFPSATQAQAAQAALGQDLGLGEADVRRFSDREMLDQIDADLHSASPLAAVGQELNLIKAHRALAERGYHWLVVRAPSDQQARQVAACVRPHGAERAQLYGQFIIEELIQHTEDLSQVAESPDRGLDAQTPSGTEAERAELRPPTTGAPDDDHRP